MKQSAVEWLESQIHGFINTMPTGNRTITLKALNAAKELEQQENSNENAKDFEIDSLKRQIIVLKHMIQEQTKDLACFLRRECKPSDDCLYWWYKGKKHSDSEIANVYSEYVKTNI